MSVKSLAKTYRIFNSAVQPFVSQIQAFFVLESHSEVVFFVDVLNRSYLKSSFEVFGFEPVLLTFSQLFFELFNLDL